MIPLTARHWLKIIGSVIFLSALGYLALRVSSEASAHPHRLTVTPSPTGTISPTSTTPTPTATPTPTPLPNPAIDQIVNLGLPIGNATAPRHLALDRATGLLYIFSGGQPILEQGNSLTVYDTLTGTFTDQIVVNEAARQPLDLHLDPTSGHLYALWEGSFESDILPTLSLIDGQSLLVLQDVPNIQAMAVGNGLLYTLSPERLTVWRLSPTGTLVALTQSEVTFDSTDRPHLAVNPATDRLYLALFGSDGWQVEILVAETLTPVGTYPLAGRVLKLLPNPGSGELFVVESDGDRFVHRLSADGEQLDPRYRIDEAYTGSDMSLSPDGTQIFFSGQLPYYNADQEQVLAPGLISLTLDEFVPGSTIFLPTSFEEIVINEANNRAFALNATADVLYDIDLSTKTIQSIDTAIEIRDVLVDGAAGALFVSDSASRVRRLEAETLSVLAETTLDLPDDGESFIKGDGAGELALDKTRNRLYVSGVPAFVLEADRLDLTETITPGGHIALAPGGEHVYLSNCGVTILEARTLISRTVITESLRAETAYPPNPCVSYSKLDADNQLLYSLAPNGVPGSNAGRQLHVYDVALEPTQIFTDFINFTHITVDPAHDRAFVSYSRDTRQKLFTLTASPAGPTYTDHLDGLTGQTVYSPPTNRLYISDRQRLLVLEADTLNVIGTMPLPANYGYQVTAIDPETEMIYLIGLDGQLLIADGSQTATRRETLAAFDLTATPTPAPSGPILALETLPSGDILALINSGDDLSQDIRLFKRTAGQPWQPLSQNLPTNLAVQDVVVAATETASPTLFIALNAPRSAGGIYQSVDGGQTWQATMAGLVDLSANRLFISPNFGETDEIIMANTLYAGLHTSLNGGQVWQPLTDLPPRDIAAITADSAAAINSDGVLLASYFLEDQEGVFRATVKADGQLTAWQPVLAEPLTLLAFAPDNETALGFGRSLWRSGDGGLTWQPGGAGLTGLDDSVAHRFIFSPDFATDQTAYLFFKDVRGEASGRLFRSTDGGAGWQLWDNPPPDRRFTAIVQMPAGEFLLGDDETQVTTIDPATMTWAEPPTVEAPFPLDDLAVSPDFAADETLFAVSHAEGLFKSTDGGDTWQQTAFPVRSTSFEGYHLAVSPDFGEDQTLYVATGFSLHRSEDSGQTWQALSSSARQSGFPAERLALSPDFGSDDTLLVGTPDAVFRSTDRGDSWRRVLARPDTTGEPRVLLFEPDGDAAYAWFDYDSTLFISRNGGQRWTEQPGAPADPFPTVTGAVSPAGTLMLRPDFFPELFRISETGQRREALTEVLPNALSDVRALAYTSTGALVAGGQGGLFRSEDGGQSWQPLNDDSLRGRTVIDVEVVGLQIFVVLDTGQIFVGNSGGNSWQDISVEQ